MEIPCGNLPWKLWKLDVETCFDTEWNSAALTAFPYGIKATMNEKTNESEDGQT